MVKNMDFGAMKDMVKNFDFSSLKDVMNLDSLLDMRDLAWEYLESKGMPGDNSFSDLCFTCTHAFQNILIHIDRLLFDNVIFYPQTSQLQCFDISFR
jgi:hypothetical protein